MGPTRRIVTIKRSGVDGAHFPLSLSTCLFGRGIECDIRIQLPVVSKQHCKIEINEQEAILHNFSSTNPTQVNGSVIDEPVQLKHGDVITIIDRSFRYENESLQKRSKSTEFPRKIHGQEPARRVSRSSFSSNPDGKAPDSKAYSKITEGKVSGSPQVHIKTVKEDSAADDSEDTVAQETSDVHSSEQAGRNDRNAAHRISGDFREISRVKLMSHCGELKSPFTTQCLDDSQKNESPFRKLYQSMKKELDVKSQKENVPQYCRKSGLQTDYTTEKESADGLQQETQLLVSRKSRTKSGGSSHAVAEPASPEQELAQAKGKGRDESVQTPSKAVGVSFPLYEPAQMKTPEQYPQQQNSPQKHKNKNLYTTGRRESVNLGKNKGFEAGDKTLTPRKLSARNRTPAKVGDAADSAAKPGNLSSKTRGSIPTDVEVPPTETKIQNDPFLTLWLTEVERKIQKDSLHRPEKVGATTGQMCPELPGLSAVDISNFDDSLNKSEGMPLKRRRVSFGGHLRPELFDENLPPNTPLKRGETPTKRKSLVVHTPPVLKKIIKEQPQPSGEQQSTSEIHLEVMAQSLVTSPPAPSPRKTPVANDRRSCQAAPASSSKSQTEVSKRGGRKSGNLPSKRVSLRRSQHGILQMICSKRRSGASEANLIVAKSWADVVKLGAKQTQTKVVKHGPQRSVIKRQRRPATPKKPAGDVHSQFSTGHANSPCTIIIGKAHTEKVHVPAQPYRMLNNFISNQKRDFKEDLSGIAEMFKTPVKEQPQLTSTCHTAVSNSENLLGKKVQVTNSGEEALLPTSESFGGNAFFSTQNAAKELSDSCSVSPTLTRPSIRENRNTAKTPRNTYKMTSVAMKTSDAETEPSKTISSANKLRRSTELRNVQKLPAESKSEDANAGVVNRIPGRCQKTSPLQWKRGGEMKEIERPFETCKENIELKENVEKMKAVKRSRRTWGQTGERVSDLTDLKSLPDTEPTKDKAHGQELLQTQDHAEAPDSEKGKITKTPCKALQPEPTDTPTRVKQRPKTSLGRVGVKEERLAVGKLTQTPGETTHTHTEPAGDGKSIRTFKESPNPVAYITGMKRWPRTPKEEAQSVEDLAGFKELFQTPGHTEESITDDKTTNIPSKSPPESADTPTSTKQRPKRSLRKADAEEEFLALRKLTPSGKAMHTPKPAAGAEEDMKALMGTPVQKLDLVGNLPGSKRHPQTPKEKAQALEDLAGFKELFRTPGRTEESVAAGKTPEMRCKSPQPDPVDTPTSTKQRPKRSLRKADIEEEFLALRKLMPSAGKAMHTPNPAVSEEKDINTFVGTPVQKLDLPENLIGSKRRPQTPKEKAQALEDLAGFKELLQTPGHTEGAVATGKTTKMPCKSSPPESADTPTNTRRRPKTTLGERDVEKELLALMKLTQTPGGTTHTDKAPGGEDTGIKALKETGKQKLDPAASVTGSKKQLRTPKRKAQSLEDLTGSKELFQTPVGTDKPTTDENTSKVVCKSPQPDPVDTPTSFQAQSKRSLRKADVEEFSALRKRTSSAGKAMHTHKPAVEDEKNINAVVGTPVQKLDLPENLTGSKRRPQTPKEKAQALEDLAGLEELFQTPHHTEVSMTNEKTARIACNSLQPDPDKTPASSKQWLRTSLGKVGEKEELLAVGKLTQMPVGTTHTHAELTGDGKSIRAFKESPKQILDPAASLTGSKRQPKNSKEKAEVPEDLVGFKELFQTPGHTKESMTNEITTKIPYSSSPPDPVDTPISSKPQPKRSLRKADVEEEFLAFRKLTPSAGKATPTPKPAGSEEKDINALMRTPVQKPDLPGNLRGSRRRPQTPKEKVQALEDLTGFKELFQTPCADKPTTDEKTTKIPCKSQLNPVDTPASTKQRPKRSLKKADIEQEFSALGKLTPLAGKVMNTPKPAVGEEKDSAFVGTPVQKPDLPGNLRGSKRRPQTPKETAQAHALEELAGFRELFQTPGHTEESTTTDKIAKVSCKSPQPDPVKTPTSSKRRLKTSLGKASVKEEVLAVVRLTQMSGETMHTHTEPARDGKSIRTFKESAKQMLDSADYVTGMKRWPRTPKEEAQSLEDLAGIKELFQTPGHTEESKTDDKITNIPCKSAPPESVDTPTSTRRRPKTPLGKRNAVEELSALKRLTKTPGGTTHTDQAPGGADTGIKALKETAKQKLDPAASVTGSKRQLRTPKKKAQSLEDLTGLKELFQTPVGTGKPRTNEKTTRIASKSPQPDPADTPTSFQAQPKRSLGKADIEEEFLALRKTSAGKAMHTPKPAAGAEEDMKALMGTPVQKADLPENLPGSKRQPQTPKEKAQALDDLAGFKELFQTPGTDKPTTDEKTTKMHCKSPQPDPVDTPTSTIQQPKRSLRKAEVEEEFSALRKLTPSARKAMHTPKPAVSDEKNMNTFVETLVQKLDLPGNLPGSKRWPQIPKEKAEALEDLAGFKELFQTPDHSEESMTDDKITGVSCKSPQPEPFKTSRSSRQRLKVSLVKAGMKEELLTVGKLTRTSGKTAQTQTEPTGGSKSIRAFKESPKQIMDPAASVTGSRRPLRTRKEKAHVLEDPGVFKELIPAPGHTEESMTTDKNTKIPCKSSPPEPADTAKNTKRCPRTRLRKEVREELSAVQKLTQTSGQSAHTHTEPASDGEGIKVFKQRAKKTPTPGGEEPSRRRPRAPKAKTRALEDLAGFKELSETPGHTQGSLPTGKAAKMPCKSPPLELVDTRTSTKRHLRTHAQKIEVKEEPSAAGKFTQTSGETADADKASIGKDKGIKASKESAKQTLAPAACVTGSRRRPRVPRENAHALEDLAGFQDPAPAHPKESLTDDKTTEITCKSLPEPVDTATSSKRRPRTRAQKAEVKEEPLAAGQLTPASGKTTHTDKEPAGEGNGVKAFKQPAKRKLDPENVTGNRRRPRAPKEKAQPPEDLASFQEFSQTPGHTEELANGADSFTGTPKQTSVSGKPLKISRRVLRASKVEPVGDQVGTRDLVKSQRKSNSSLPPPPCKRGCGKDGRVTGTKRLRFMPVPEEIVEELPASKKQRVPPRVRAKSPEPLVVMKRSLRTSAERSEPVEEPNSHSMNTNKEEHKLQDSVPANKGMSLRARRQKKTDVEQPTTEVLILAERMKVNRNAKKPMKTSQEMDMQSPDDGAQKAIPRGKAGENKRCLRSVRQNKSSQPKVAEESEGPKSTGILVQNQEGKGEAGPSDSVHLRSRKTKSQSAASALESESAQRVTRGVKRCAENPKKAEDIVCIKKIRTRSHQDSEDN
uniref:Marker of proliferation Ki-67 n=1 Tax=Saimiri boliviensis boliviensis TaxID=39432 RepID=A0A2K6TDP7_SAIBB